MTIKTPDEIAGAVVDELGLASLELDGLSGFGTEMAPSEVRTLIAAAIEADRAQRGCALGDRAKIGSLYVAPNGDAYRLRRYGLNWEQEPMSDERTVPDYSTMSVRGSMGASRDLPEGSVLTWEPDEDIPDND